MMTINSFTLKTQELISLKFDKLKMPCQLENINMTF